MNRFDVIVIGAGMSGLVAARELQRQGQQVVVLDKGRGVGGRVATRRIEDAVIDHGCQFFTASEPEFLALVKEWRQAGCVVEWCRGFGVTDGHARYRGDPSMTALAKHLARDLDVRLQEPIVSVEPGWRVISGTGAVFEAEKLVLTPPVPQTLALLDVGQVTLPTRVRQVLDGIQYDRCLTVMALLDGSSRVPPPGALAFETEPVIWVADCVQKGISARSAVVIHGGPEFSLAHWDGDRMQAGRELLAAASQWLGSRVVSYQVHGWKFANPQSFHPEPCVVVELPGLAVFAGDAFGEGLLEGAVMSGFAAAKRVLNG